MKSIFLSLFILLLSSCASMGTPSLNESRSQAYQDFSDNQARITSIYLNGSLKTRKGFFSQLLFVDIQVTHNYSQISFFEGIDIVAQWIKNTEEEFVALADGRILRGLEIASFLESQNISVGMDQMLAWLKGKSATKQSLYIELDQQKKLPIKLVEGIYRIGYAKWQASSDGFYCPQQASFENEQFGLEFEFSQCEFGQL